MMIWSWSWWLADCRNFLWLNCWLNHGEDQIRSVWVFGLLLVSGLMLLCCSLLYSCLLDAHMTTQALNKHTISLSRLDCLHFLSKICSCVVYQLYILVQHYLYLYSVSEALLDYFVVLHYYSSLGLCYCLYLMWLLW